jgi:hypothetical protein
MAKKPSYVGVLNAIAIGERGGHELFRAWADSTTDEDLKPTLNMAAVREMEHSYAFEKRLNELGFSLVASPNKEVRKLVRVMKSKASDADKFAALGVGQARSEGASDQPDRLLQILSDPSIDPQTGELMGRFICEERDTGKKLAKAFAAFQKRQQKGGAKAQPKTQKKAAA